MKRQAGGFALLLPGVFSQTAAAAGQPASQPASQPELTIMISGGFKAAWQPLSPE